MVTPELLEYMRTEIAKGKTREEIRKALIYDGGWSENDLSEAFRVVIPMQRPAAEVDLLFEHPAEGPTLVPATSVSGSSTPAEGSPKPAVSFSSPSLRPSLPPSSYAPSLSLLKSSPSESSVSFLSSSIPKFLIILIVLGGLGFGAWYFRSSITGFWDSSIDNLRKIHIPSLDLSFFNKSKNVVPVTPVENNINNNVNTNTKVVPVPVAPQPAVQTVTQTEMQVKDCGTKNTALKLGVPSTYENDPVLACLGAGALNCENVKGVLKDDFFPTIFEITKQSNSCNFKLSYGEDSILTDIAGNKLAGQYISCPIDIVKAIDNTNPSTPRFIATDKTDLSKYGSQIYFYGILGLFVENNLDQNKIQKIGCIGSYINSVVTSYQKMQ